MEITILKNADLLTMHNGPVTEHGDVWIADGKIRKIDLYGSGPGNRAQTGGCAGDLAETPGSAKVIDCTGCTVMPGLIDSHVHYDESYMGDFFLASGITSVRNMRGHEGHAVWRDEILAGKRRGPYIYSSGPVYDGDDPTIPHNDNVIIHTRQDVENAIRFVKENGFLWMKTYPSIEADLYRYLLRRCAKEGLPVCGHMTKIKEYSDCDGGAEAADEKDCRPLKPGFHKVLADEGYRCCEHTSSLPSDPEMIRYVAESGMWFCPTHVVCETLPDYVWNGKQLAELPHYMDLPECVRNHWEESNKVIIANYRELNVHPDFQTIIDRGLTFLKYSDKVMAGTDCPYPGVVPGFALADELEKLVSVYGMSVYDALCAATCRPAEHIGIAQSKGRIMPGMDSDLVVLGGNPLEDIGNVRKIRWVFQGTRSWDKEALQRFLTADSKLKKEEIEFIVGADGQPLT